MLLLATYWCCCVLQCVAVCCIVLQCVAVSCSVLQCVAACRPSQYVAVCRQSQRSGCYSFHVAVCSSLLQCVAVCRHPHQFSCYSLPPRTHSRGDSAMFIFSSIITSRRGDSTLSYITLSLYHTSSWLIYMCSSWFIQILAINDEPPRWLDFNTHMGHIYGVRDPW